MHRFIVTGDIKDELERNQGLSVILPYRVISMYDHGLFLIEHSLHHCSTSPYPLVKFSSEQQKEFIAILKLTGDLSTAFYPLIEYIEDYINNH